MVGRRHTAASQRQAAAFQWQVSAFQSQASAFQSQVATLLMASLCLSIASCCLSLAPGSYETHVAGSCMVLWQRKFSTVAGDGSYTQTDYGAVIKY